MSHTNVSINPNYDKTGELLDEIEILNFKLKQCHSKINGLNAELQNIPKAIEQYGYVDISWDGPDMRLVKFTESEK